MKTKHLTRLVMVSLLMAGLLTFVATSTKAITGTIGSTVNIECAVEIASNGGSLDFGYLAAPGNGLCDVWTVSPINGVGLVHSGTGNGTDFLSGDHSAGSFTLTGSEPIIYSVAVTTDFSDGNLTLSNLTLDPLSPQDPSPMTGDCLTLPVSVGGDLQVCPGAAQGLHNDAVITITANY